MDDEHRLAIRSAAMSNETICVEQPQKLDVYVRECDALFRPGTARDDVIQLGIHRMGLEYDEVQSTPDMVRFIIGKSSEYRGLYVKLHQSQCVKYNLVRL